jgi:RNA polymerase sigma-70 factor (ECF subfamily)
MSTDDDARDLLPAIADAQARFMALVAEVRPELHRYCARMTGSPFDGEDVVQDTLAKACFALAQMAEPPPLRPWLFRIAHNTAMDFVRRYDRTHVDVVADVPEPAHRDEPEIDASLVEAALDVFMALPPAQRSALALKDVLGHSLEQTAVTMGTSVAAVKSALVRARASVAAQVARDRPAHARVDPNELAGLRRYADRFNARDWDGLRQLLAQDSRLDLVSRWQRRGPDAAAYYTRYAEISDGERLRAQVGSVGGVPVVGMFRGDAPAPAYFVRIEWSGDRIALVRDFRYAAYVVDAARFEVDD